MTPKDLVDGLDNIRPRVVDPVVHQAWRRVLCDPSSPWAACAATSIVWIPAAQAGTIASNVADGILTVNGTNEGDDVTVRCEGGQVTVNHDHPSGGPTACADLRRILAFAGEGPDRVSLADVT